MKQALEKHRSKINGFGIFSGKRIQKGEMFYKILLSSIQKSAAPNCAFIGQGKFADDPILNFVNHSCEPNTVLVTKNKHPFLKAKKKIVQTEEITCNYNLTEPKETRIKCNCGSERCKGYFFIAKLE